MTETPAAQRILLLGLMGAGKTTVGQALAARTGWPYLDNDELVERVTGRTAKAILADDGVDALRDAESRALTAALTLDPPVVAGVAGGAVTVPADYARLRDARTVVWLRARHDTLVRRIGPDSGRPWLPADPTATIESMAAEREPRYAEVADLVVDVDDLSPEQIAVTILTGEGG